MIVNHLQGSEINNLVLNKKNGLTPLPKLLLSASSPPPPLQKALLLVS